MNLLDKVVKLENEAAAFGFCWENAEQIMAQIQSEFFEIKEHIDQPIPQINQEELQAEIGDLLHAVFSLCVFCKFSPSETLSQTLNKFERRLNAVKAIAQEQGYTDLNGHPFEKLMVVWDQAKTRVG
ncbi:MazG nucleotide pyrophosphohydrolase domain-containing protein [Legionella dresdenensis]|uniref:MazG nucleotide pyrophosphohydrolase domain-containing protein n=1 Tax=Legionella dresdenensis TaxID=450200 RepID=A0ABV8CD34_9GAMM